MTETAIEIKNLRHAWPGSPALLDLPEFQVEAGERVFLAGRSGSGKSTLLSLIAGVTPIQSGQISVLGQAMDPRRPRDRDRLRADQIGVIFQMFNLVPYLDAVENILLPLNFSDRRRQTAGGNKAAIQTEAQRLLSYLGLDDDAIHRPAANLSVGQQQRVAAARALIGAPGLIIADEPTSALDEDSRNDFLDLLTQEAGRSGAALLFVSHERSLAPRFDRVVELDALNTLVQAA